MEAKKVGIITQVRMTSTRLPGKVLKLVKSKPLLSYHVERLRTSDVPIIIATTTNAEDDPIYNFASTNGLPVYRGSEHDVLSRFYHAAVENKLDIIVRVTSDCPLIDGALIRDSLQHHLEHYSDNLYTSNVLQRTYPRGFDFEIFSFARLKQAFLQATEGFQREHVTPFINLNTDGQTLFHHIRDTNDRSVWRITVDTPDDFELIQKLIVDYNCDQLSYAEMTPVLDMHPELQLINAHIEQKKI